MSHWYFVYTLIAIFGAIRTTCFEGFSQNSLLLTVVPLGARNVILRETTMDSDRSGSSDGTYSSDFSPKPVRRGVRAKSKADRRLRERERVFELGKTYKILRNILTTPVSSYNDKKINKIPIIEAAIKYIEGLQQERARCTRSELLPPCTPDVKPHPSQLPLYTGSGGGPPHGQYSRLGGPLQQCGGQRPWRDRQTWNF